jgi:hypothetical protein
LKKVLRGVEVQNLLRVRREMIAVNCPCEENG